MKKRKIESTYLRFLGVLLIILFCVTPSFALIFSEIQFDPAGSDTDREWVEIFNDTSETIDLTNYKFFENNTNHGIDVVSGDKNVVSGEYVVLVQDINKFKTDFPNYSGKIFKSSFSLSNSGEILSLKDKDGNILNTINYSPSATGAGNGSTINYDGINYFKAEPSVGTGSLIVGQSAATNSGNSTTTQPTSSTTASTTEQIEIYLPPVYYHRSVWPESEKIYLNAGNNKVTVAGADTIFTVTAVTGDKRPASSANFFWSFGDGETAEGKNVYHVYKYVGEYVVDIEAYYNGYKTESRTYVKVIEPNIAISLKEINEEKLVEIKNKTKDEIDIGGYLIKSSGGEFGFTSTLPKKLTILPNKSIYLSHSTLKFATSTSKVVLTFQNGKELCSFGEEVKLNIPISDKLATNTVSVSLFNSSSHANISTTTALINKKPILRNTKQKSKVVTTSIPLSKSNQQASTIEQPFSTNDKFVVKNEQKNLLKSLFDYFGI